MTTLVGLADKLEDVKDKALPVRFGGGIYDTYPAALSEGMVLVPSHFSSYRGFYKHAGLVPRPMRPGDRLEPSAEDLLHSVRGAIGEEFTAWKGGEYLMTSDSLVFVAAEGDASSIGLFDVVEADGQVILVTYDVSGYLFA